MRNSFCLPTYVVVIAVAQQSTEDQQIAAASPSAALVFAFGFRRRLLGVHSSTRPLQRTAVLANNAALAFWLLGAALVLGLGVDISVTVVIHHPEIAHVVSVFVLLLVRLEIEDVSALPNGYTVRLVCTLLRFLPLPLLMN